MQIVQCHTRLEYSWAHFCSKEHSSKKQRVVRKKSSFFNSDSVWLQSATTASICATSEEQTIKCPLIRLIAPSLPGLLACLLWWAKTEQCTLCTQSIGHDLAFRTGTGRLTLPEGRRAELANISFGSSSFFSIQFVLFLDFECIDNRHKFIKERGRRD